FAGASTAIIHVDRLPDTGEAASGGFTEVVSIPTAVRAGRISLTLTGTAPGEAYRLRIEPPAQGASSGIRAITNRASAAARFGPGSIVNILADDLVPQNGVDVEFDGTLLPVQVNPGAALVQIPDTAQAQSAPVQLINGSYHASGTLETETVAPALFDSG